MTHECTGYSPGHAVHWIQAGLTLKIPGEIKKVCVLGHDEHWLTFEMDGEVHRVWNHDPGQVGRFHDAAVDLQTTPHTRCAPLFFTSVKLLRIPVGNNAMDLYPSWDGPTDCSRREER
jgi:hypothetical protein